VIETVLWDLGGVLCRFDPERRVRAIAARSHREPSEVAAFLDHSLLASLDDGTLDGDALHRLVRERLGWDVSLRELARAWCAAFEPDEAMLALARRVTAPAALLTNNGPPLSDAFADVLPDVAAVVPVAIFTAALGHAKPDPDAFLVACGMIGATPATTLFVDDTRANVDGARAAGLEAVRCTGLEAVTVALEHAGVLR
jgi:putative hydrolase of the HAD superfamily